MLEARDIGVRFGSRQVLHGAGLAAEAGRVTAIVGPNGSGKSTLLKAIAGDLRHSGRVTLDGRDVAGMNGWELAARRAVLPQATALAFPFTVAEVVRMGASAGTSAADPRIPGLALAAVDLAAFAPRLYQDLSGGEQQRVQIARVLAQVWAPVLHGAARWLILDEPVASLDIAHQIMVMEIARRFARAGGGVIAVMHDLNLTAMCADRIVVMVDGRVIAHGGVADVMTDVILGRAYGCALRVNRVPGAGMPFILPQMADPRVH